MSTVLAAHGRVPNRQTVMEGFADHSHRLFRVR